MSSAPLVSVGIPTYDRAASLRRALESVLAQSYANLEILVSDNASSDETPRVVEAYRRRDRRVRSVRHAANRGAISNFRAALQHSRGEYFMWLADDDWLDATYVAECLDVLLRRPDHVLVSGVATYFRDGHPDYREEPLSLTADRPQDRVLQYYRSVKENGIFYGLMRRSAILRIPIPNVLANDWLIVASLAFLGKLTTLGHPAVNREIGGASWQGIEHLAAGFGLRGLSLWNPYLHIARLAASDILHSPVYLPLAWGQRAWLANRVQAIIHRRYTLGLAEDKLRARADLPGRLTRRLLDAVRS